MVLKKRIYYGAFHGLLPPVTPKAPRSLRRRTIRNKSSEGDEICAFELLAAVAGELLQESESSTSSIGSEKKEQISVPKDGIKLEPLEVKVSPVGSEHHDQASGAESEVVTLPTKLDLKLEPPLKDLLLSENDSGLDHASNVTDFIKKDVTNLRTESIEAKPEGGSPSHVNICDVNFGNSRGETKDEAIEKQSAGFTAVNNYGLKDEVASCVNNRVPKKPSSSVHLPFYRDPVPSACYPRHRDNVNINIRDDDEKYFRYNNHSSRKRVFGTRLRAEYRRIRKMLTYRYWKATPKMKDYELADTTSGVRSFDRKRKNIYMRERYQAYCASKRRKLYNHSSKTTYIESSGESIANSVKFSIKSFKVPELYVEVPETATVGSLKRSVMEAVTAILQGNLHVGVLLQGKKVRDDNRTLQQTGISQNCNLETLGFTLEPNVPEPSPFIVPETPLLLPCNTQQQLSRSPSSPNTDGELSNSSLDDSPPVTTLDNHIQKIQENITFTAEVTAEKQVADSKALVLVPARDAEVLSMVPMSGKTTKTFEFSQRRTRRTFSVTEVEALVEAVETLGTGRWRDVKMRAFDDANHRTYVDLKDKWKTLVHTASIAPQQRRGEPVPQNLLDRVLAARSYWSQHQSKQNAKQQKTLVAPM